jgi:hypothetical protein
MRQALFDIGHVGPPRTALTTFFVVDRLYAEISHSSR